MARSGFLRSDVFFVFFWGGGGGRVEKNETKKTKNRGYRPCYRKFIFLFLSLSLSLSFCLYLIIFSQILDFKCYTKEYHKGAARERTQLLMETKGKVFFKAHKRQNKKRKK